MYTMHEKLFCLRSQHFCENGAALPPVGNCCVRLHIEGMMRSNKAMNSAQRMPAFTESRWLQPTRCPCLAPPSTPKAHPRVVAPPAAHRAVEHHPHRGHTFEADRSNAAPSLLLAAAVFMRASCMSQFYVIWCRPGSLPSHEKKLAPRPHQHVLFYHSP